MIIRIGTLSRDRISHHLHMQNIASLLWMFPRKCCAAPAVGERLIDELSWVKFTYLSCSIIKL